MLGIPSIFPAMDDQTAMLDNFGEFLRSLPLDTQELSELLEDGSLPESTRLLVAGSLNYLFKSLDLVPDTIADLGFLDDTFVLRIAARIAKGELSSHSVPVLDRLAAQARLVDALLGADATRMESYVRSLCHGGARGRMADEIVTTEAVRASFLSDLKEFAASYAAPVFVRDEKNLVKLKAFLTTKLPA